VVYISGAIQCEAEMLLLAAPPVISAVLTRPWCGHFCEQSPLAPPLATLNQDKTQIARLIDDRLVQLLIAQMIELARQADFRTLDPVA
jgi:hypothetical protein